LRTTVKILFFLICAISFRSANAQVLTQPDGILLQLVARDASGNAASVRNVYSKVTLIKTSATGEVVYVESHKTVTMSDGIFTIIIGKGSRISGASSLTAIDWRSDLYFLNLKVAIEPTIPTPGWDPNNEYVDMGTSQMWTVPYAFFANRANIADSAQTISSLLPGSKGGTGVVNDGKTITLDKNFALKGLGNLTFNTSGTTILNLPTSGSLTTTQSADTLFNKTVFSPKLTGTPKAVTPDIASNDSSVATTKFVNSILDLNKNILNTKIDLVASNALTTTNEKVNISDTAAMLNVYKLSMIDKDNYKVTNNAVVTALVADTATLITRLGYKVNAADTAAMLNVYKLSMIDKDAYKVSNDAVVASLVADTATLITRLGYKVNAADTAAMLNVYKLSMIDKDAYKVSNDAVVASLVADTATLITRLGYKVNASDTAAMLSSRFMRDTASLSNRIDDLSANSGSSLAAEITRATTAEALKVNFTDTAAMLNVYKLSMIDKDAYKVSNDAVVASLVADTATLITRLGYKVNAADTAAMLNTYARKFTKDFDVKIGTGKYLGKYKNGDVIPAIGKTLDDFMTDVLTETIHPTYIIPSASITSAPSSGEYEIGSVIASINLSSTYNQNDGGAVVATTYKKSTNGGSTYNNLAGTSDNIASLTSQVYYQVNISYGNGAVKNNNLGVADNVGIITAGNVTSGAIVFTPRSKKYWGTSDNTSLTDAEIIANSTEYASAKAKSSFNFTVASGTKYIYYAYPASYGLLTSITVGGFESISAFTPITRIVVNAQGYSQSYNIYVSVNNFTETVSNVICN